MRTRVVVIGAGIAGLAAASSLARAECDVVVLEQAPEVGELGAGLGCSRNGLAAAEALGVANRLRENGWPVRMEGYRDHRGRGLMQVPEDVGESAGLIGVHRRFLHAALVEALPDEVDLRLGGQVVSVDPGSLDAVPQQAVVQLADGSRESAELVVAADGIWSRVRAQLFPGYQPEYTGRTCWRAVVEDAAVADGLGDGVQPVLGPGAEFGALRIGLSSTYWYGYVHAPARDVIADEPATARRYFESWEPRVRRVVEATDPASLIRHDVHWMKRALPSYCSGRVVLIGDAAHAMIPTMGQGANSSLEDGVSLGPLVGPALRSGESLVAALQTYDLARRPRTQRMVREAAQLDMVASGVRRATAAAIRRAAFRAVPVRAALQRQAWMLEWEPPVV